MSYSRYKQASFGAVNGGLATVGYRLYDADGDPNGARITAGVAERGAGTGTYGATVTFPDGFEGEIRWDTGEATPKYASEDIDPAIQAIYAIKLKTDTIGSVELVSSSIVDSLGIATLFKGFDYTSDHSQQIDVDAASPDLTGATIELVPESGDALGGTLLNAGEATQAVRFEFTDDQVDALSTGSQRWTIRATFPDGQIVRVGELTIKVRE